MFTLDDALLELELAETAKISAKVENGMVVMEIVPWSEEMKRHIENCRPSPFKRFEGEDDDDDDDDIGENCVLTPSGEIYRLDD